MAANCSKLIQSFEDYLKEDLNKYKEKIKEIHRLLKDIDKFKQNQSSSNEINGETTDFDDDLVNQNNSKTVSVPKEELFLNNAKQFFMMTDNEDNKIDLLIQLFKCQPIESAIIYCKSVANVENLTTFLIAEGFEVHNLIGKKGKQRKQVIEGLNSDNLKSNALITVRRIDSLQYVSIFINYDLPTRSSYIKKVGSRRKNGCKYFVLNIITTKELNKLMSYGKHFKTEIISLPINTSNALI